MYLRLYCAAFLATGSIVLPVNAQSHPFSVTDDIEMVRFDDPALEAGAPINGGVITSPDGRYFAVITTKGILQSDCVESDLSIFDKDEISVFLNARSGQTPKPRTIAKLISYPHREELDAYAPVIKDLRWSADSKSVYFRGETLTGTNRLYFATIDRGRSRAITPANESVGRFDTIRDMLVYTASSPGNGSNAETYSINRDAEVITGRSLNEALFSAQFAETFKMSVLHRMDKNWAEQRLPLYSLRENPFLSSFFPFSLSPKGDKLIELAPLAVIPSGWEKYEPAPGYEVFRLHSDDSSRTNANLPLRPEQYSLVDIQTGSINPVVEAPNARVLAYLDNNRLAWAKDGRRVLLTNTFLPLNDESDVNFAQRTRPCAIASIDIPSRLARCIFFEERAAKPGGRHVIDVSFGEDDNEALALIRRFPQNDVLERYRLQNGQWMFTSSAAVDTPSDRIADLRAAQNADRSHIELSIRQSLNDPPTLWASNSESGRARQLWDPNPQFKKMAFGEASPYHWKDRTGYEWSGLLIKPVDFIPGKRYPAVLQMYSFPDDRFVTDGMDDPTAFAARHLASAGFVVLQIKRKPTTLTQADADDSLEGYEGAIQSLSTTGMIDAAKVGVVGFSWTCWYAVNALIKDPKLFAAATIADGLDNSYMQYLMFAVSTSSIRRQMESISGGAPFGGGLKKWKEEAPGFHLDQVQTPVRIETIRPLSVLQEWELYSSLRMQGKPVDLIYFPQGTHVHQKPMERLESQQGNVDWMRFWLQGYEDNDPAKRAQYQRWNELKKAPKNESLY